MKDPVKGLIYDIKKFAVHDGPGIRTTVFFKGCPLECWWCQNPESIGSAPESVKRSRPYTREDAVVGREVTVSDLMEEIERDIVFYDESGGGVTASGGEPLMQAGFLSALLAACREKDIHTAVDTSGFATWSQFEHILPFTDLFLYDIKLLSEEAHQEYTNVSNQPILENLEKLDETGKEIILRIPLIPNITDTEENLKHIAEFISGFQHIQKIDLLPYNKLARDKYKRFHKTNRLEGLETQTEDKLKAIQDLFDPLNREVRIGG